MAEESTLRNLAAQFRKPEGEQGLEIANKMFEGNAGMIAHAFSNIKIKPGECVVEIGPGLSRHLESWFSLVHPIRYVGVDHSAEMVELSKQFVSQLSKDELLGSEANFMLVGDEKLPVANGVVDKIVTVNTLYFIPDPAKWLTELHRVLRKDGRACITFSLREFMESVPFTAYGFRHYDAEDFAAICRESRLKILEIVPGEDVVRDPEGNEVIRRFVSFILQK